MRSSSSSRPGPWDSSRHLPLSETGGLGRFRVGAVRRFPAAARGPRDSGIRRNRAGTSPISSYFSPHCDAAQPPAEVAVRWASSARSSSARARAPPWCSALRPQCDAVECDEARASDRAQCGFSHSGGTSHCGPAECSPVALRPARVRGRRVGPAPRVRRGAAVLRAPRSRGAMDPTGVWHTATGPSGTGGSQCRLSHCDVLLYPPCRNRRLQGAKVILPGLEPTSLGFQVRCLTN